MTRANPPSRRLLYVLNDCAFFLSHRLPLAIGAQSAGFEVAVCTPPGPGTERLAGLGIAHFPFYLDRGGTNPLHEARSVADLARIYREWHPEVLHQVSVKPVLYGTMAARVAKVPAVVNALAGLGYVFNSKSAKARVLRPMVIRALRLGLAHENTVTIFQNPDDRGLFLQHGIVDEARTVLIRGSGVALKQFVPHAEPVGEPVVALASRMLWNKGIGEFVHAASLLRKRGVAARFVLVGDPDRGNPGSVPREQLIAWASEGTVEWWGKRSDMPEVFRSVHIVTLPSYYGEGVPKVLLEAAACGRPIVTTDEPGCREAVRHGDNGLLVPARDADALASALETLISNTSLRERMGARGRERALDEFDVCQVVDRTLGIYAALSAPSKHAS